MIRFILTHGLVLISLFTFAQKEITIQDIVRHVGDSVKLQVNINNTRVLKSENGSLVLMNVSKPYPNQVLTLVIYNQDLKNFTGDPEKTYQFKTVIVRGKVSLYKDKPQIVLHDESQITLIPEVPGSRQ
jgi:hypothetical protein